MPRSNQSQTVSRNTPTPLQQQSTDKKTLNKRSEYIPQRPINIKHNPLQLRRAGIILNIRIQRSEPPLLQLQLRVRLG